MRYLCRAIACSAALCLLPIAAPVHAGFHAGMSHQASSDPVDTSLLPVLMQSSAFESADNSAAKTSTDWQSNSPKGWGSYDGMTNLSMSGPSSYTPSYTPTVHVVNDVVSPPKSTPAISFSEKSVATALFGKTSNGYDTSGDPDKTGPTSLPTFYLHDPTPSNWQPPNHSGLCSDGDHLQFKCFPFFLFKERCFFFCDPGECDHHHAAAPEPGSLLLWSFTAVVAGVGIRLKRKKRPTTDPPAAN
jgi:hypothetical protein